MVITDFKKLIQVGLTIAFIMLMMSWVLSGGMGSLVYRTVSDGESVNSILNGITLENYDYISGKGILKNGEGQEIVHDPKNSDSLDYLTGYRAVSVGDNTIKLNPVDTDALYKVMPHIGLNISNVKSQDDLVKLTDANVAKQFIDYLVSNREYDKIKFIGYSTDNKTVTYNNLDKARIVTLQLGDGGFYKISESKDVEASDSSFALSLALAPFMAILLFGCFAMLDKSEDDKRKDKSSSKVSLSK